MQFNRIFIFKIAFYCWNDIKISKKNIKFASRLIIFIINNISLSIKKLIKLIINNLRKRYMKRKIKKNNWIYELAIGFIFYPS